MVKRKQDKDKASELNMALKLVKNIIRKRKEGKDNDAS